MRQTISIKLLAAAGLLIPGAFGADLIKNGSFEKPLVPSGAYADFATGSTALTDWQVVGAAGDVSIISTTHLENGYTWPAAVGQQWLDLTGDGSNSPTGVQQTVATTAGTAYTLTFYVGNAYGGPFLISSTLNVFVNGTQTFAVTSFAGEGMTSVVWQKYTTTIVATSAETTIAFMNGDGPDDTESERAKHLCPPKRRTQSELD